MVPKAPESGVILIDKPPGMTSHDVVQDVKRRLGARKAGHTGTLDSPVTGLLVVALGEATKAMPVLMGMEKGYEGTMHVNSDLSLKDMRQAAGKFVGRIVQVPPKRSRVVRKPREREVMSFSVTGKDGRDFRFAVRCQAGTYIRKLVHDLGEELGCGAHMTQLRRTSVGPFDVRESKRLDGISRSDIMPLERALDRAGLKKVLVGRQASESVMHGMPVKKGDALRIDRGIKEGEVVGVYLRNRIIALAVAGKDAFRTDRVFQ